jgi:hypothetical protein
LVLPEFEEGGGGGGGWPHSGWYRTLLHFTVLYCPFSAAI